MILVLFLCFFFPFSLPVEASVAVAAAAFILQPSSSSAKFFFGTAWNNEAQQLQCDSMKNHKVLTRDEQNLRGLIYASPAISPAV